MGLFSFGRKKKIEVPRPPAIELDSDFEIKRPTDLELPSLDNLSDIGIEKVEASPIRYDQKMRDSEKRSLDKRDVFVTTEPVYINFDDYKGINDELSRAKVILTESEDVMIRVSSFNGLQDAEYKRWNSLINDMEKRFLFVDNLLFGRKSE